MPFYYYTTAAQEADTEAIGSPRVFRVTGTTVELEGYGPCPTLAEAGQERGRTYITDPSFDDAITVFLRRHANYTVIFRPSLLGEYCSVGMPAMFVSEDGAEILEAEDVGKYVKPPPPLPYSDRG